MKRVLFVASVSEHIRAFHIPYLKLFKDNGYVVEVASNGETELKYCDKRYQVDFERSPIKKANFRAYKSLKKIINDNKYEIVHCHTPVAAMLTRLACRKARKKYGTKVIYTAHGFHFFKGAPLKNWLLFLPVEWICSFFTDILININREDYNFSQKHMHSKNKFYVPGVGLHTKPFDSVMIEHSEKRAELGIPGDSIAVLSVGELNNNKNHKVILNAIAKLNRKDIVYVICGKGDAEQELRDFAKEIGMEERLILAGFRRDLAEIYPCCDVFAFPSLREGLPVSLMEAMYFGLPCIASRIRGNVDLIEDEKGGFLFNPFSVKDANKVLEKLLQIDEWTLFSQFNKEKIDKFTIDKVMPLMVDIYDI